MLDRAEARALVLVASIAAIPACAARAGARDETRSASMDGRTERTNADVVRSLYELGLNTGDVVVVEESVAPDFVGPRGDVGPAAFARTLFELRAAFPDLRYTIEDLVAEGDRVALRWTLTGTHAGAPSSARPGCRRRSPTRTGTSSTTSRRSAP